MSHSGSAGSRGSRRSFLGHLLLLLVALAVVWSAVGASLWKHHEASLEDAVRDADALSLAYAETVSRIIAGVDQTLLGIREKQAEQGGAFDLPAWRRAHPAARNLTVELAIIDRNGLVSQRTAGRGMAPAVMSDLAAFKAQEAGGADTLAVGPAAAASPDIHPATASRPDIHPAAASRPDIHPAAASPTRPAVVLTRRLTGVGGVFDGVVAAFVEPDVLTRFGASAALGHGAITLMTKQGITLARAPDPGGTAGQGIESPIPRADAERTGRRHVHHGSRP